MGGARLRSPTEGERCSRCAPRATGLDLEWPERLTIKAPLRQPYALIERDRQSDSPARPRVSSSPPRAAEAPLGSPPGCRPYLAMTFEEVIVEGGKATGADDGGVSPVRFEIPRVDITARQVTWPAAGPAQLRLDAALPGGGTLNIDGSVSPNPLSADVTLAIKDAGISWLHPYLGFRAQVGGRLDASLKCPALWLPLRGSRSVATPAGASTSRRPAVGAHHESPAYHRDRRGLAGRIVLDRTRRSWALIQRLQGRFFQDAPERPGAGAPRSAPSASALGSGRATRLDLSSPSAKQCSRSRRHRRRRHDRPRAWRSRAPGSRSRLRVAVAHAGHHRADVAHALGRPPRCLDLAARPCVRRPRGARRGGLEPAQSYLLIDGQVAGP